MKFTGPPKRGPVLPLIGKGYFQANITEIRRIVAGLRLRLERVAKYEQFLDNAEALYLDAADEAKEFPNDSEARQEVKSRHKRFLQARARFNNARAWAAYTMKRRDLYLDYALEHTLKNNHPASKAVWTELRLMDKQRKWESRQNYAASFVEFLKEEAA